MGKSGVIWEDVEQYCSRSIAMEKFGQSLYVGEFRHNLDAKKRLTVPSKWRFEGDEKDVYLAFPDPSGCITVYPPEMVAQLHEKLSKVSLGDKKGQRAITRLLGAADSFTFDKSGRININERLFRHASIQKEVVLVGTVNKFSLWSPDAYESYIEQEEDEGDLSDVISDLGL